MPAVVFSDGNDAGPHLLPELFSFRFDVCTPFWNLAVFFRALHVLLICSFVHVPENATVDLGIVHEMGSRRRSPKIRRVSFSPQCVVRCENGWC